MHEEVITAGLHYGWHLQWHGMDSRYNSAIITNVKGKKKKSEYKN